MHLETVGRQSILKRDHLELDKENFPHVETKKKKQVQFRLSPEKSSTQSVEMDKPSSDSILSPLQDITNITAKISDLISGRQTPSTSSVPVYNYENTVTKDPFDSLLSPSFTTPNDTEEVVFSHSLEERILMLTNFLLKTQNELHEQREANEKLKQQHEKLIQKLNVNFDNERKQYIEKLQLAKNQLLKFREMFGSTSKKVETTKVIAISTEMKAKLVNIRKQLKVMKKRATEIPIVFNQEAVHIREVLVEKLTIYMQEGSVYDLKKQLALIKPKYERELQLRRQLHNKLIEERGNIRVHCRIRPFLKEESREQLFQVVDEDKIIIKLPNKQRNFEFDFIHPPQHSQSHVFEEVKPMIMSALDGYNISIMAYGQTGSGKTYTLSGNDSHPGIIPLAIQELFSEMNNRSHLYDFKLKFSMIEIYLNNIRDLLVPSAKDLKTLDAYDLGEKGLSIATLTEVEVKTQSQILKLIQRGSSLRAEHATLMNEHSSRSHCIVTIEIESIQKADVKAEFGFDVMQTKSCLRIIDLAGSENATMSGVTGINQMEASSINKSLAALGDVMLSLASKQKHVPYRNSKLTQYLQNSLSGEAKMLIFVNISPTAACVKESLHALSFGMSVRSVERTKAKKNILKQ